jgi:hypothetical protein
LELANRLSPNITRVGTFSRTETKVPSGLAEYAIAIPKIALRWRLPVRESRIQG